MSGSALALVAQNRVGGPVQAVVCTPKLGSQVQVWARREVAGSLTVYRHGPSNQSSGCCLFQKLQVLGPPVVVGSLSLPLQLSLLFAVTPLPCAGIWDQKREWGATSVPPPQGSFCPRWEGRGWARGYLKWAWARALHPSPPGVATPTLVDFLLGPTGHGSQATTTS